MTVHGFRALTAAACVSLAMTACGGGTGEPTIDDTTDPQGAWVLVSATRDGAAIPIVEGARITLTIEDATYGGTAACNSYSATFDAAAQQLRFDNLAQTDMGCAPDVMASEQAYLAALVKVEDLARDGDQLTLSGPGVQLSFTALPPVPTAALVGTVWELDTLLDGDSASSVQGALATLVLHEDGTLTGSTGCRALRGTWTIAGDQVLFPDFSTDHDCPADLAAQDGHVVEVLGDGFQVAIEGDRLTITSRGNLGLSYRAAE